MRAASGGVEVPHIAEAREHTRERLAEPRSAFGDEELAEGISVCVFGSWAREELAPGGDDDWAVLAAEPFAVDDSDVASAMAIAEHHLAAGDRGPGAQGVYRRRLAGPLGAELGIGVCADEKGSDGVFSRLLEPF